MVLTFKSSIVHMGFVVALLLGSAAALSGAPSAEARTTSNVHPVQHGHQIGFGSQFMERRADVVFDRGYWTRGGSGYTYGFDVTNRGNLPASGVLIAVTVQEGRNIVRNYQIDVGRLNVGERKRYAVWFSPNDTFAAVRLHHSEHISPVDTLGLRPPAVRDHRT